MGFSGKQNIAVPLSDFSRNRPAWKKSIAHMDLVAKAFADYLHDVIYHPARAALDVAALPPDFRDFGERLQSFAQGVADARRFIQALSKGEWDARLPSPYNEIAAPLLTLQAALRHLTWQIHQVAAGDYKQRVDFMGNFSVAFNAMAQQLEERREREAESQSTWQQYVNLLLRNSQEIILLFDMDGAVVFTSDSYLRCCNILDSPDSLQNTSFNELFAPVCSNKTLQEMNGLFLAAMADHRSSEAEYLIDFGKLGNPRQYLTRVAPMLDEFGIAVGTMLSFRDMTESISALAKMQADERMRIMLDATPLCAHILDKDFVLIDCNQAAVKLFGLSDKQEFLDRLHELSPQYQPCGTDSIEKRLEYRRQAHAEGYCRFEWMHQKLDGEPLPCEVIFVRVQDRDDFMIAAYTRDLRELKAMLNALHKSEIAEASNRAKSKFLATMSHEIRTPMNAILGITEIQLQSGTLSQDTLDAFYRIYTAGYTLLGIINDLLDLSRMEAGKVELMPGKYDIASLINDSAQLNMVRIGNKPIAFRLEVDEDLPAALFGDDLRIKQILNNLLSNAFKYTQAGEVVLSVSAVFGDAEENPDVTLVCRVSDTGSGMTKEQVDKLFDEYARFNQEANRTIEGIGLGMSITRQLVYMMGGEIYVDSEPDKGSTFTVRLPQADVGAGPLGREAVDNLRQLKGEMHLTHRTNIAREPMPYGSVLVADDLETNLYVTKGLLAPYGLAVDTVLSGFAVIDKIRAGNEYDIIFMDHMMPKMDGVETTKLLRDLGYARPVIALTANAVVGQAEMFLDNGFDGFLSKPMDLRQLNQVLNKLIRDKQSPEVLEAARRQKGDPWNASSSGQQDVDPQLAVIFVSDAEKTVAVLEAMHVNQYRRDNDMHLYVVNVHAMKSALAHIGEAALAVLAHKLEQAGRKKDRDVMLAETPTFLDALRAVIEKVRPRDDHGNGEASDEDPAYLREQLSVIHAACAAYDKKAAKDALSALRQKTWSRQTWERLDTIARHLLHSDFEDAAVVAAGMP